MTRTTCFIVDCLWKRPIKFLLVGAIGIGVQIAALYLAQRLGLCYLIATAIAVESAILHNFIWHEKFTWVDRRVEPSASLLGRFLRFQFSNGVISLAGNIILMRGFVGVLGVNFLLANLLSIAVCCIANFLASDRWVFAEAHHTVNPRSAINSNVLCAKGE